MIVVFTGMYLLATKEPDYSLIENKGITIAQADEIMGTILHFQISEFDKHRSPVPKTYVIKLLNGSPSREYLNKYNLSKLRIKGGWIKHINDECKTAGIYLDNIISIDEDEVKVIGTVICSYRFAKISYRVAYDNGAWKVNTKDSFNFQLSHSKKP